MKLRWTVALLAATTMSGAVAQDTTSEKGKLSYAVGYQIGRDMSERKLDVDLNTVIRAVQDGYAKRDPSVGGGVIARQTVPGRRKRPAIGFQAAFTPKRCQPPVHGYGIRAAVLKGQQM